MDKLIHVGEYNPKFNKILGLNITQKEIYRSTGLPTHLLKRSHTDCLKYIDYITDIIENPDYIGVNPRESGDSIELVKRYKDNVLIGIKVDMASDSLYVATMFKIQDSKLERRIHGGRLKKFE